MNFTKRQLEDLETIEYFIPSVLKHIKITDEDRKMFLENSERGLHNDKIEQASKAIAFYKETEGKVSYVPKYQGFNALIEGKKWRGIHIHELYEQGVLEGNIGYFTLLGGLCGKKKGNSFEHDPMPRSVVNFLKKEMFQGIDADLIEETYQSILNDGN